jgi:hypothetical protein
MEEPVRKLLIAAGVLFVAYFLITQPAGAANVVEDIWDVIVTLFEGIADFIGELFS